MTEKTKPWYEVPDDEFVEKLRSLDFLAPSSYCAVNNRINRLKGDLYQTAMRIFQNMPIGRSFQKKGKK